MISDYEKYRGKCKEECEKLLKQDPSLTMRRGYYHCPIWGKQQHFWCTDKKGKIVDPTKRQFPSKGCGEYEEFDGKLTCEQCGKPTTEEDAVISGSYACCSGECMCRLVGLL
jgi:hypothetical protein